MAAEETEDGASSLRDAVMRLFLGDDIATANAEIGKIADFEVSDAESQPFIDFIRWINPRPAFIAEWRSDPELERRRYLRFMQGLEACRAGYAASAYHLGRLREIEDAVHTVLSRFDFSKSVPRGTVGAFGQTRRWDFEYQAFVLAYRRTLDGLAWGLSTYFKHEQSSFRQFAKHLSKYHPNAVAQPVAAACARHIDNFRFVMGSERGLSTRDRISHREAVAAGTINVGSFGHRIVGGGEDLGMSDPADRRRLAEVLGVRINMLHACIVDLLTSFRLAVTDYEAGTSG